MYFLYRWGIKWLAGKKIHNSCEDGIENKSVPRITNWHHSTSLVMPIGDPRDGLSCKPNIYVSWSTSELRVRLAPLNRFKPSSKIFYWPFQGGTSFVDLLCFCSVLCLLCFVRVCLYVLCGHLLGKGWPLGSRLWCLLWVCHFPIGILGQVWYLIVSIPDLCNLITFTIMIEFYNAIWLR